MPGVVVLVEASLGLSGEAVSGETAGELQQGHSDSLLVSHPAARQGGPEKAVRPNSPKLCLPVVQNVSVPL